MDMQKEREEFQECYKTTRDYKFYIRNEMSEKQIFEFKKGKYIVDCVNDDWKIWQAAKASAQTKITDLEEHNYSLQDKMHDLNALVAVTKASAVPVLDKPAKVGGGTFQKGIKWSTVIGAAQRHYEYSQKEPCHTKNVHQLKGILFAVPDGYVVVPKEPTEKMIDAGHAFCKTNIVTPTGFYKAMIEAAQEQSNAN